MSEFSLIYLSGRSYEELKVLREIAVVRLRRRLEEGGASSNSSTAASSPQQSTWLPLWGGWYSAPPSPTDQQQTLTKGEKDFLQALQQESEVMGVTHKDVVFRQEGANWKL
jgi:hypothetical protein